MTRTAVTGTAVAGAMLALALAAILEGQSTPQTTEPQATFRSSIELLAVDVSVLDKDGRPVSTLAPADFDVEVGGERRPVVRAEFIDFTESGAAVPDLLEATSNQTETATIEPRIVLLLVDDESFGAGGGRAVFHKLAETIGRLFPRDAMGFATISGLGRPVEFTTNRKPIEESLRSLIGRRVPRATFDKFVSVTEAFDIVRGGALQFEQVVERECRGETERGLELCKQDVENEARNLVMETEAATRKTLDGLSRHFQGLASLPGTKYILFVSQGFIVQEEQALAVEIARTAAAAGVTLHALYAIDDDFPDASVSRVPMGFGDSQLRSAGLDLVTGAARGTTHRLLSDPSAALERIRREMSGVYRLGIEMQPGDRGTLPIRVRVAKPGLTVRSYRHVVTPERERSLSQEQRLARVLQSPLVDRSIAIRLAAFGFRASDGSGQVLVSAEADASAAGLRAAYVLRDEQGTLIGAGEIDAKAIVDEPGAPALIVFTTKAPPGDYTLKLALLDKEGRTGSISRPVSLHARAASTLALGDLVVLPEGTEVGRTRPSSRIAQGSRRASVYFELYAPEPRSAPVPILLEIADSPDGEPLVSSRADVRLKGQGKDVYASGQIRFSPAALPPGRYFARLRVAETGARAVRGFGVAAGSSASAALLSDEARALLPRFRVAEFLSTPLMQSVSKRLGQYAEGNLAVQDALRALEDGTWRDVPAATGDAVTDATLSGLHALAAGRAQEAELAFRQALEADPEFTLALALTGGAWASVGRDREATRSWRTSLATGIDAPFLYKEVTTALLRSGDVKGTREFLGEIEETGTDPRTFERDRALAAAIAGDRREAAATLASWVDAHPEDTEAAFLLVLALYELKTIEKDGAAAAQFDTRAKQYIDRNGPRRALVERWRK
jgi:hypothetical protein